MRGDPLVEVEEFVGLGSRAVTRLDEGLEPGPVRMMGGDIGIEVHRANLPA